jgi:hypothetical protein
MKIDDYDDGSMEPPVAAAFQPLLPLHGGTLAPSQIAQGHLWKPPRTVTATRRRSDRVDQ